MCALIQANGWNAIGFATAAEFYSDAPEKFECMVIDIDLPDTNGLEVQQTMRQRQPEIPIIVVSGLAGRDLAVKKPVAVFDKPIDPDEFMEAVRRALPED